MFLLRTESLILRHITISDLIPLYQGVFSDQKVMYFGEGVQTQEWVNLWIHSCLEGYEKHGFGAYAIVEQNTNEVIGYCGLFYFPDINGKPEVEIGYRLVRSKWGLGYATEAAIAVRDFAFSDLNLSRLIAMIDPENVASIRVAEKLGMIHESDVIFEGYTHPDRVYSINKG